MPTLPITRVVLYKHGVGYFEREGTVDGDVALPFTFKQAEVSDVLKSLTVLDLDGGHIASVSYDSTKPLEQLLAEVAISIPDQGSLVGLLPQIKGARVALQPTSGEKVEGLLLGVDTVERQTEGCVFRAVLVSILTDAGGVSAYELQQLSRLEVLDPALKRDLEFYLRTQLSAKKKDARTFTFFAQGNGQRRIRLSYTLEAPVWKATYRIILGEEGQPPMIQGWAVVDNTQDEDWEDVELSLVAGLPVSFVHDLYTPRYIRRPVVAVQETTGVLPPEVEAGMQLVGSKRVFAAPAAGGGDKPDQESVRAYHAIRAKRSELGLTSMALSTPAQVRERQLGDLFEYQIEHPVSIRRNQSALVPIVLRSFEGRPVLLYNKQTRPENPMRSVEFKNTTGLTLEGGPVTVLEAGNYVGEAMLDTMKPDEQRLVPYAVELSVKVLDNIKSHEERTHHVVIRRGSIRCDAVQVRQTTYAFNNQGEQAQKLYLDHSRTDGVTWDLIDTPEPKEVTQNNWRFLFELPAKRVTEFVVRQRYVVHQNFDLRGINNDQLGTWMQQKYFDKKTEKVLRKMIELHEEIAKETDAHNTLERERGTIHGEQKRIRENLDSLGDRPTEKELRERFVRTLGSQEDRLEAIEKEQRDHLSRRDKAQEELDRLLGQLEYEADVASS